MKLNDNEKKALETLNKVFQPDNLQDIFLHYFIGRCLSKVDEIVKDLPVDFKNEVNKRLNK